MNEVRILDVTGQPMKPAVSKAQALAGNGPGAPPYDAASVADEHLAGWQPYLWSPDSELNIYRDRIVSRMRDLVRNDGWAAGTVTRLLDKVVGGEFHPVPKPDFRALAQMSGNSAFDATWAGEYGAALKANYRMWANGSGRYCDAQRLMIGPQLYRVGYRHKLIDGDAIAVLHYLEDRVGPGRARYATAVQLIDPDRLSNPQKMFDTMELRGGVEVDGFSAAVAYHIQRAHQGDWWAAADSLKWDRIPRETEWGRPIVVHDFEHERAGAHRGGTGVLSPVLTRLKMLFKYDGAELDSALINAIFGAYVESPFDSSMVSDALGDGVGSYQEGRAEFHDQRKIMMGNARLSTLYPGEKFVFAKSERPNANFPLFEKAVLRNAAAAAGVEAPSVTNDFSDLNYSSYRGALIEFHKTTTRRRFDFAMGFCQPIYGAFVEESHEVDDLPMPSGYVPAFIDARDAYARARWMGPGMGWLDPVDEAAAAILRMDGILSDLDSEAAEQGMDGDELLDARAHDLERIKARGLPLPSWAQIAVPAREAARKPEPE